MSTKYKQPFDAKLAHLSENEIQELIEKYYSGYSSKKIISEYKIDISATKLYTLFPKIIDSEEICKYCNTPMEKVLLSRSSIDKYNIFCPICGHKQDINCHCYECRLEKQRL